MIFMEVDLLLAEYIPPLTYEAAGELLKRQV
jgi:hypothetical protein